MKTLIVIITKVYIYLCLDCFRIEANPMPSTLGCGPEVETFKWLSPEVSHYFMDTTIHLPYRLWGSRFGF